ncbi:hypothetical protein RMS29_010575 [Agrobacterium rosae]|uniref:Uncharacterized protein n=1 Tax=Agrobacterium rosae TaxID=1972867 RepID=A0AAE5VRB9_9HYPH|nr:hypothetical protein [Agrobacterium rosae]KAA3513222.1 hypothetical protein DXM21_09610 [Agrobacterium rosae]KAA3521294.1 hypothetical protein DXM25_08365 [Agrobacterium rosae]MCM2432873.1 hypothetical protein [Agrobacterium rosae]MDX8328056.1 hypothetical protein [Agrobacterium rosae]MQB48170.1 hypothetical protein [Agrobacterium rosae]
MEIENVQPEITKAVKDVAEYILQCHDGDATAAIEAMQEEIEHLQHQLSLAVVAMGRGYTRGWVPSEGRDGV